MMMTHEMNWICISWLPEIILHAQSVHSRWVWIGVQICQKLNHTNCHLTSTLFFLVAARVSISFAWDHSSYHFLRRAGNHFLASSGHLSWCEWTVVDKRKLLACLCTIYWSMITDIGASAVRRFNFFSSGI